MLRTLRIAVSVVSGLCCVLVIVLWVRSYENQQPRSSDWESKRLLKGREDPGRIFTTKSSYGSIQLSTASWDGSWTIELVGRKDAVFGFGICKGPQSWSIRFPHWFAVTLSAALAVITWPYRPTRFSLRTLLLATTAVAILLGLLTYATRG